MEMLFPIFRIWKETHTSLNEVMYEWTYEQVMQANAVLDMFQSNDIAGPRFAGT